MEDNREKIPSPTTEAKEVGVDIVEENFEIDMSLVGGAASDVVDIDEEDGEEEEAINLDELLESSEAMKEAQAKDEKDKNEKLMLDLGKMTASKKTNEREEEEGEEKKQEAEDDVDVNVDVNPDSSLTNENDVKNKEQEQEQEQEHEEEEEEVMVEEEKDEQSLNLTELLNHTELTFIILPASITFTQSFPLEASVTSIKEVLVETVTELEELNPEAMIMKLDGQVMENNNLLSDFSLSEGANTPIELVIQEQDEPQTETQDNVEEQSQEAQDENDESQQSVGNRMTYITPAGIEIIREYRSPPPFIGGYRSKKTKVEYHHAVTQTPPATNNPKKTPVTKYHRDTQTVSVITCSTQTSREASTQSERPGHYIDTRADIILTPREAFTSDQLLALKEAKAITIQRFARGFFARKKAKTLKQELFNKKSALEEAERTRKQEAEKSRKKDIQRRMNPRSMKDFEILYTELEAWRYSETQKINTAGLEEQDRLAALAELLQNETRLLQTIDRLRLSANVENRQRTIGKKLELMSAPKKWAMSDGSITEVHTPFTTRAAELRELYNGLKLPLLTIDERLDVLFHVKWTVKEFDCNLTRDIVELIDRESDLLHRGRSEKSLVGLRTRLNNLFLQFMETPEFNPEAARFQKVPADMLNRPNTLPITSTASLKRRR